MIIKKEQLYILIESYQIFKISPFDNRNPISAVPIKFIVGITKKYILGLVKL